jgi:hypothetical protein
VVWLVGNLDLRKCSGQEYLSPPQYREKLATLTSEIICQVIIFAAKKETHC